MSGSVGSPDKATGKIDPGEPIHYPLYWAYARDFLRRESRPSTLPSSAGVCADVTLAPSARLGILPKKRVDLLSTSPSPPRASTASPKNRIQVPIVSGQDGDERDDDPNPSIPSAPKSLVSQIPKTPPEASPYTLEDSDDELEYTR